MATRNTKPTPMTEQDLQSVIGNQIQTSRSYLSAEVAADRAESLRMYLNRPLGNEIEGRSQVISSDVQDTIEALMPDLVEIFCASGQIITFNPTGAEDEAFSEQVTDYVNDVVLWQDNPGYEIIHDFIKDCLVEKKGILKIWWDDERPEEREELDGVTFLDLAGYMMDPNVEIVEYEEETEPSIDDLRATYSVTLVRRPETGRIRIEVVPSEEFVIGPRDQKIDETASFLAHLYYPTRSDLVEMGYDKDLVWSLPYVEGQNTSNLDKSRIQQARWSDDRSRLTDYGVQFESQRQIEVYECYPLMDYEGTGVSKRYLVRAVGSDASHILPDPETGEDATEIPDHPFVGMDGIRMPHRFFGRAVADLVRDVQKIKSTIQRQTLDNMYNMNNARAAISNKVDLDDFLSNDVGSAISVDTDGADVSGHIQPLAPQPLGNITVPLLEYWDSVRQERTGATTGADPIDPQSFHQTFGGANLMLGQVMKRMLFIARTMAETGFVSAGRKILKLVVNHQDAARTVRLRGEWVSVDPRRWNAKMDVRPTVGLGHGTKESRVAGAMQVISYQEKILANQGGRFGGFVQPKNVYNALDRIASGLGEETELYFNKPDEQVEAFYTQSQQPQPSELEKIAQAQQQLENEKIQLQLQKERNDTAVDFAKIQEDARQHDDNAAIKLLDIRNSTALNGQKLLGDYVKAEMAIAGKQAAAGMPEEMRQELGQRYAEINERIGRVENAVLQIAQAIVSEEPPVEGVE